MVWYSWFSVYQNFFSGFTDFSLLDFNCVNQISVFLTSPQYEVHPVVSDFAVLFGENHCRQQAQAATCSHDSSAQHWRGFFPSGFTEMTPEALFGTVDHTLLNSSETKSDPWSTIGKIFIE